MLSSSVTSCPVCHVCSNSGSSFRKFKRWVDRKKSPTCDCGFYAAQKKGSTTLSRFTFMQSNSEAHVRYNMELCIKLSEYWSSFASMCVSIKRFWKLNICLCLNAFFQKSHLFINYSVCEFHWVIDFFLYGASVNSVA